MTLRWYIVHTYSGAEKRVATAITEQAAQNDLSDRFEEVCVPTQAVIEVKKGKKVTNDRKFFPGYIMVKMDMNDEAWHLVKNIPKVTGFLGGNGKPQPISDKEANDIFKQIQAGIDSPRHTVSFAVGETVKVIDGPFDSFVGVIEELDEDKEKLKIAVSIFGRSTPVELEYTQVEKN